MQATARRCCRSISDASAAPCLTANVRRNRMRSIMLFFLAMFVSTALVELCVLRRCFGRRSLAACVGTVSVGSGVFWLVCAVALSAVDVAWKVAAEPAMTGSDMVVTGLLLVIDALLLTTVALIPAGLVAVIYRRLKCQP